MVFLGGSQTFLGVLAAIIVMCILVGDGNFIFKILSLIKSQMEDDLKNVSADVNFNILHNDSDYKLLKTLLKGDQLSQKQKEEGTVLLNKVTIWKSSFQAESVKPDLKGLDGEIILAPLYTFLLVILVFIFDELLCSSNSPFSDILVSTLSLLLLFSIVYWFGKWLTCSIDILNNFGRRSYTLLSDGKWSLTMQRLFGGILGKDNVRLTFESMWCVMVLSVLLLFKVRGSIVCYLIIGIGVLIPLLFEGLYHFYTENIPMKRIDKGYETTFNHFVRFLVLSVVLSLVLFALNQTVSFKDILIPYENLKWLKYCAIGFVILNGFLVPFIVPYQTYSLLSKIVRNKPNRMQKKVNREIRAHLEEIKAFTAQCNVDE